MYESDLLSASIVIPRDEFNTESNELKSNNQKEAEEIASVIISQNNKNKNKNKI